MKVLIADSLPPHVAQSLVALGLEVSEQTNLTAETLPAAVVDTNILVVRSTRVTLAALDAARQLALVVRAGAGVNTIDVEAASRRGVYVANCPGTNTAAVAELAIGLLIAADRRIVDAAVALRGGAWRKTEFGRARGLAGRTLGILGFGAIGKAVARRAQGLEMKVIAWSRSLTPQIAAEADVELVDTPHELAARADAVSLHLALVPQTRQIVGADFLAALRPGAILVNTARGELVDEAALAKAIESRGLRVGLDVLADEPAGGDARLADTTLPQLATCTPHIGASTDEAAEAVAAEVVRIVERFVHTGHPPSAVNLREPAPAPCQLVVRHLNRVGVLAGILDGLRAEGINIDEMDNKIFAGGEAAACTLQLDAVPTSELLESLRCDPNILHLLVATG